MSYLVRQGQVQPQEVPQEAGLDPGAASSGMASGGLGLTQRPVFQSGFGPQSLGQAYHPAGQDEHQGGNMNFRQQYLDIDRKKMEV